LHQLTPTRATYKVKTSSLGIELAVTPEVHQVFTSNHGDKIQFCKPTNTFGLKVSGHVMNQMRDQKDNFVAAGAVANRAGDNNDDDDDDEDEAITINCIGETKHFSTVIKDEAVQMARLMGAPIEEPNQRQMASLLKL